MDVDDESGLVGEFLQFRLPQPHARSVGATAVGGNRQRSGFRIARAAHTLTPGADRLNRELGRVGRNPDADPALIGGHIVDAVGDDLAKRLVDDVVHLHALRLGPGECSKATANQMRLMLHGAAYWLWWTLRAACPKKSPWRRAQFDTLRLHLVKLAATIVEKKTRIIVTLPASCPQQGLLRLLFDALAPPKIA